MYNKRRVANNCEKATFLIEKRFSGKLSVHDNVMLRVHLEGCPECRIYLQQSTLIDQTFRQIFCEPIAADMRLDIAFKQKMQQEIERRLRKIE